jgi:hypothetical protein
MQKEIHWSVNAGENLDGNALGLDPGHKQGFWVALSILILG